MRRGSDWVKCHVSLGATDYHTRPCDMDMFLDLRDYLESLDPTRARVAARVLAGVTPTDHEKGEAMAIAHQLDGVTAT